jgi:hypothetical protein
MVLTKPYRFTLQSFQSELISQSFWSRILEIQFKCRLPKHLLFNIYIYIEYHSSRGEICRKGLMQYKLIFFWDSLFRFCSYTWNIRVVHIHISSINCNNTWMHKISGIGIARIGRGYVAMHLLLSKARYRILYNRFTVMYVYCMRFSYHFQVGPIYIQTFVIHRELYIVSYSNIVFLLLIIGICNIVSIVV